MPTDAATGERLLAQIVGPPDPQRPGAVLPPDPDPGLRLAYADWLEDVAQSVSCGRCQGQGHRFESNPWVEGGGSDLVRCAGCNGSGLVAGPEAARAEFIRVQVEVARSLPALTEWSYTLSGRVDALRRREGELLDAPSGQRDGGKSYSNRAWWSLPLSFAFPHHPWERVKFRRGFVASVTLRGQDWWGSPGSPGHGPAIVRAAPIEVVELSGLEPDRRVRPFAPAGAPEVEWTWFSSDTLRERHALPTFLWPFLSGGRASNTRHRHYDSPDDARAALSSAALAFARLPPCGECHGEGQATVRTVGGRRIGVSALGPILCRPCHGLGRALS